MRPSGILTTLLLGLGFCACSPQPNQDNSTPIKHPKAKMEIKNTTTSTNGIVGGHLPADYDLVRKYTVAIVDVETLGLCSGTIVGKRLVVTAAHCITSAYGALVLFGPNVHKPNHIISPAAVTILPGYEERSKETLRQIKGLGDVAIIQLKEDIPPTHRVAKIIPKDVKLKNGDRLLLAGYGAVNDDTESERGILRSVNVNVIDSAWGKSEFIIDQRDGAGACFGDSGGPAFYFKKAEYFLVGITSRAGTYLFDRCGGIAIYSHAGYYRDFILSNGTTK